MKIIEIMEVVGIVEIVETLYGVALGNQQSSNKMYKFYGNLFIMGEERAFLQFF